MGKLCLLDQTPEVSQNPHAMTKHVVGITAAVGIFSPRRFKTW